MPTDVALISPMPQEEIDRLDRFTVEQFRTRVVTPADRRWAEGALLCSGLPGGNAQLAAVIGYGMAEDRRVAPSLHEPHNFNLAWLRATPGEGLLRHRHEATQVVTVKSGRWVVRLNADGDEETVTLGPARHPVHPRRRLAVLHDGGPGTGTVGHARLGRAARRQRRRWAGHSRMGRVGGHGAREAGHVLDANGYLAPTSVLNTATEDD